MQLARAKQRLGVAADERDRLVDAVRAKRVAVEQASSDEDKAKAEAELAKAKVALVEADVEVAKAEVEVAKAELAEVPADNPQLKADKEKALLKAEVTLAEAVASLKDAEFTAAPSSDESLRSEKRAAAESARASAATARRAYEALLPTGKRKLESSEDGMSKFLRLEIAGRTRMPEAELGQGRQVLRLQGALYGKARAPTSLFLRKCYEPLRQRVLQVFEGENNGVFVAGTRGTGKSVFGGLMVLELNARGKLVVFEHLYGKVLIVPEGGVPRHLYTVFGNKDIDASALTPGIYNLSTADGTDLARQLVQQPGCYFVQDLGDTADSSAAVPAGEGNWLLLSSPNAEKLKSLRANPRMVFLIMPLWSLEELQQARDCVYAPMPADKFSQYTPAEVSARFELYGGVPRYVLERPRPEENLTLSAEGELDDAVATITTDQLSQIFGSGNYHDIPKIPVAGILVHVVEKSPGVGWKLKLATEPITKRLIDGLVQRSYFNTQVFIDTSRRVPELGAFRGYALEQTAHRFLKERGKVRVFRLGKTRAESHKTEREVQWRSLAPAGRFSADDLGDLAALSREQYAWPTTKIFPTLDSFAVVPLSLFYAGKQGDCLAVFQVTVSDSHDVRSGPLTRVVRKVKQLLNVPKIPVVLVFVTDADGVATAQTIWSGEPKAKKEEYRGNELGDVDQFGLYLRADFEELAKFCRETLPPTAGGAS